VSRRYIAHRGYRIRDYATMIADRSRLTAYRRALRHTVRPGATVLDLGTGSGVLALIACHFGARRVVAVETDEVIELARVLAQENGCADRIAFVQGKSTDLRLTRRVDVLVSDVRGSLPFHGNGLAGIVDARRRLLRPGGTMIPARDIVYGALVRARCITRHSNAWRSNVAGVSMEAMWRMVANATHPVRMRRADLGSSARRIAVLDYRTLESTSLDARLAWPACQTLDAQGLVLWFDSQLAPGVTFSNAPGRPPLIYGQTLLPWPEPVRLRAGERVLVRLRADPVQGAYVWRWTSEVRDREGRTRCRFDQSTFLGQPISRAARSAAQAAQR
jgi:protein arginine N-methyltransferase 1